MRVFHEQNSVPVNSCILIDDEEGARTFPRGEIRLAFCDHCGFIRNAAFEPERTEYSGRYEETQAYSPTFNTFHRRLAEELIERHRIRGKRVIEIGCGKGEFLALICELGGNSGVGFDPSYDEQRGILGGSIDARVVRKFYEPEHGKADADVVVCKMTLEHIEKCLDFVAAARLALKNEAGTLAFFQIPEASRIFREGAFEDIYYEHCSYFTPGSAARLFRTAGFDVRGLDVTYAGQYLTVEASNGGAASQTPLINEDPVDELAALVDTFAERCHAKIRHWRDIVEQRAGEGPVVIWGSSSKGVAFLHALERPEAVRAAVDVNPNRHSKYMLGTGQPIVAPQELIRLRPRTVIAMNSIYRDEIAENLEALGVSTELLAL
jgi:SAM-dependent methyltransferase